MTNTAFYFRISVKHFSNATRATGYESKSTVDVQMIVNFAAKKKTKMFILNKMKFVLVVYYKLVVYIFFYHSTKMVHYFMLRFNTRKIISTQRFSSSFLKKNLGK